MECEKCGIKERVSAGLCAWCRAEEKGYPYGQCDDCHGAKASDGTCACKPPKRPRRGKL